MGITIYINKKTFFGAKESWLKKLIQEIFSLLKKRGDYELEINLLRPSAIQKLNKIYRGKNRPTTILSFVASESKGFVNAATSGQYLGEIFLCPSIIKKQAKKLQISTKEMMTIVMLHGILHLLGYTHNNEKNARKMEHKEEEILRALKRQSIIL